MKVIVQIILLPIVLPVYLVLVVLDWFHENSFSNIRGGEIYSENFRLWYENLS